MKNIILFTSLLVLLASSCQPTNTKKTEELSTSTNQQDTIVSESILGKYIVVKEDREIIRNGKITESTSEILDYKTIYDFKSENLVSFFLEEYEKPINLNIHKTGLSYHLTSESGEAEEDLLILKKHTPHEVIFVRETGDGDEQGEILVKLTLHMKPIK